MKKIAFIGGGKMASAIAAGLVKDPSSSFCQIRAFDPDPRAAERFFSVTNVHCDSTLAETLAGAQIVLICVKPQYVREALAGVEELLKGKLLISIAAGVSLEKLSALTGTDRIIRVMPNTPALAGEGMSCYCSGKGVTAQDEADAGAILSSFGLCKAVPERLMDAVTGLSGSGPAYVFEFIMALADGGVMEGLPRDTALLLAAQTVMGSAKMVLESKEHIAVLRDNVISPGGTTACGVAALDEGAFRSTVSKAVSAAAKRSGELGKL